MHSARTRGFHLAEDGLREQKKPVKGKRAMKFMRSSEHSRREVICMRIIDFRAILPTAFHAHSVERPEGGI